MRKKQLILILLALFIFNLCVFTLNAADDGSLTVRTIFSVLNQFKLEYVEQIDQGRLLNASIWKIKQYLKDKNIKVDEAGTIPENETFINQAAIYKDIFYDLLKKCGNKATESELVYVALDGIMDVLHKAPIEDPYTIIFKPKDYKVFREQLEGGNFSGIGVFINADKENKNALTIVEPIEGTPAFDAGIKSGDIITKINGESTLGMDLDIAVQKIRGPEGTEVVLRIKRSDEANEKDIPIMRKTIHVKSVTSKILDNNIGYIRLKVFGSDTGAEFDSAVKKLKGQNVKGLIVDLRNNGGGYIDAAVEVCSQFLPKGTLVVTVENKRTSVTSKHHSIGNFSNDATLPLVLLVNEDSASASEITTGALKDFKRAYIIGNTTYGKASVQSVSELGDGGALKYTVAHYLTPSGFNLSKKGLEPDLKIKMDSKIQLGSEEDIQLKEAVKYLTK